MERRSNGGYPNRFSPRTRIGAEPSVGNRFKTFWGGDEHVILLDILLSGLPAGALFLRSEKACNRRLAVAEEKSAIR